MPCPHCAAIVTSELRRRTTLGYRMFRCRACRRTCNKRTGTPYKHLLVPTDIAKVARRWCYVYRAIDSEGNRVETMLSKTRDMDAAKRFFACALKAVGQAPEKAPANGRDSYPRALRETPGLDVYHGASSSMNNCTVQVHRASSSATIPCGGLALLTLLFASVQCMTSYATISVPAPALTNLSPWPDTAACSRWPSRG